MNPHIIVPESADNRPHEGERIPHELRPYPQWVGWKIVNVASGSGRRRTYRRTKQPIDWHRGSATASVTDPKEWTSFEHARERSNHYQFYGMGFVFTAGDPYVGIDLDKCRGPETGIIEPWALAIVEAFATYTEPSPSGTGLHLIGRGIIPGDRNRTGQIEMYDRARFFTMTGDPLDGYEQITDCQDALDVFYAETFPTVETAPAPRPAITLTMDDHDLIAKVRAARNGAKFDRLYSGDSGDCGGDASAGDLAFVSMLTFYNPDEAQIDRIVRQSGRYREKWERADYRASTIAKARQRTTFYEPSQPASNGCRDMTPMAVTTPERHTPEASVGCVVELARVAELEQALAERDEKLARLQDRVRAQDDELHRLRRIASIHSQVLANSGMADGPKLALLAIAPEITSVKSGAGAPLDPSTPDPRIVGNAIHIDCTAVAAKMGCSADVAGRRITKLVEAGLFEKRYRPKIIRNDETGQLMNGGKELLLVAQHDTLETILEAGVTAATPGRENQGGPRTKRCNAHPDALLVKRTDVTLACSECGEVIEKTVSKQTIDPNRQIVGSGDAPANVDDSVLTSTLAGVRVGFHEARARHFEVEADSAPNLQAVGSPPCATDDAPPSQRAMDDPRPPTALCSDCGLRLFNPEEQAFGRHSYACSTPVRHAHPSTPAFVATGDD